MGGISKMIFKINDKVKVKHRPFQGVITSINPICIPPIRVCVLNDPRVFKFYPSELEKINNLSTLTLWDI